MSKAEDESAFTWREDEARRIAYSQSGASNCGATALLNVLTALHVPVPSISQAEQAVRTNSRKYGVSACEYLKARSVAGCTGENIVAGCREVTGGDVVSRFFSFYPPRKVSLQRWLAGWLDKECSAVATINTQQSARPRGPPCTPTTWKASARCHSVQLTTCGPSAQCTAPTTGTTR